jgi:hypothetical protein
MSSDATDTGNGSMHSSRAGSISARHVGHVFFVFKVLSKHDVQKMCPHAVMDTFLVPGTSKHTAHTSTSASGWIGGVGVGEDGFHKYCIGLRLMRHLPNCINSFNFLQFNLNVIQVKKST